MLMENSHAWFYIEIKLPVIVLLVINSACLNFRHITSPATWRMVQTAVIVTLQELTPEQAAFSSLLEFAGFR